MPQEKQARSGSAAAGGGMLVLWLTMQGCGWLRQQWLPLLPQTGAAAVGLLLQLLMLGVPLIVILRLLRCPAALLCPMKKGRNGSPWLIPAGLAVLVALAPVVVVIGTELITRSRERRGVQLGGLPAGYGPSDE